MGWLVLLLVSLASASALKLPKDVDSCDKLECRAGRECVLVGNVAQCLCVVSCPDHFKPVCGSDRVSYDNHCKLHQKACISGQHISIKHKGFCKKSFDKVWKKDRTKSLLSRADLEDKLQNDIVKGLKREEKKQAISQKKKAPDVCYGVQRNALRFLLLRHWKDDVKKQLWYTESMTYREILWGWFITCDEDKDNFLTPKELLKCSEDVEFFARPGQNSELTKALCIDALVDDADNNQDWRLDFEEFTTVMSPKYQPHNKKCSLAGKDYHDGEELRVECNLCVCAVGNWVCASIDCEDSGNEKDSRSSYKPAYPRSEMNNAIDDSSPLVKDVPVVDLWEQETRNNKKKAKKNKTLKKEEALDDSEEEEQFTEFEDAKEDAPTDEADLKMDEYYDDLYEQTKIKNHKKKKLQLQKALKDVKDLQKKTEELKELLIEQKEEEEREEAEEAVELEELETQEQKSFQPKPSRKTHHTMKKNHGNGLKKNKDAELKKNFDEIFRKTKWNDLIDWGNMKYLRKNQ